MTLHALRVAVGDKAFFEIVKAWAAQKRDGNATTADFVALAERVSGKQLDELFDAWLYGTRAAGPSRNGSEGRRRQPVTRSFGLAAR